MVTPAKKSVKKAAAKKTVKKKVKEPESIPYPGLEGTTAEANGNGKENGNDGYQRPLLKLKFEDDPEFEGLVIRARRYSIDDLFDLAEVEKLNPDEETREEALSLAKKVTDKIVEWNLRDPRGVPYPITGESLMAEDPVLLRTINRALMAAIRAVPPPLSPGSSNGEMSQAPTIPIPMEDL